MATFEQARLRELAGEAGGWKAGRFAPLYLAGLALGAAAGIALTYWFDEPAGFSSRPVTAATNPAALVAESTTPLAPTVDVPTGVPVVAPAFAPPELIVPQPTPRAGGDAPAVTRPPTTPGGAAPDFYLPASVGGNATLEGEMLSALNAQRSMAGLPPFVLDLGLTDIARIRSQQMIDQGYFGHVDPFGYSMFEELLKQSGYSYAWAGENLAMNNYSAEETVRQAVDALMASPSHRDNILAGEFSRIGVGEVTAADGRHFFTLIFLG